MRILWVGYGKMGEPMCCRVRDAGHQTQVFDSEEVRRVSARKSDLTVVENVREAAAQAEMIFTSLPHDAAARSVLTGPDGLLVKAQRGVVLVETSTISVAASEAIAEAASASGIFYVRAPVSGTVSAACAGSLSTFLSGSDEAQERARAVIAAYATKIVSVGDREQARVMKLAINLMVDTLMVSLSEAYALCMKGGVAPRMAIDAITQSAIASPHLAFKANSLLEQNFRPTFTVTQTRKDLRLISDCARELGVPILLGAAVDQIMTATESMGYGEEDYIACAKTIARMTGL